MRYCLKYCKTEIVSDVSAPAVLFYNGQNQPLLNVVESVRKNYRFGVSKAETQKPESWSADIPTGNLPGIYYVWYAPVGEDGKPVAADATVSTVYIAVPTYNV